MSKGIKKCTALTVVLIMCFVSAFCNTTAYAAGEIGDVDGDGVIKIADARLALQYAAGIKKPSSAYAARCDITGDGKINIDDARAILRIASDLPSGGSEEVVQYDPTEKNGSSQTAQYCVVTGYEAETLPGSKTDEKSDPRYSALPKGTYDYIESGPVKNSSTGNSWYVLKSGRRVYTNEVKKVSGYVLPDNTIKLMSNVSYNTDSTDIRLKLDWRVPFNIQLKKQNYVTGYDSRPFNNEDDEYTATYMSIIFYYTDSAGGAPTFPKSKTVSGCKWSVNTTNKTATLTINLRSKGGFYGYTAYYDSDNYLVLSIKEPVASLKGRVIMIDPGHGGYQPGAGSGTGVYEKDITYKIATALKKKLVNAGATVVFTRDNSASVPEIEERRVDALQKNPDLFVSIHLDSSDSKSAHGSSVYYYKNYSGPLALAISKQLPSAWGSSGYNRGAHFYPFCVTRIENCPAVLVECGFISNSGDFAVSNTSGGQDAIAKSIYNGIINYFGL